MGNVGFILRPFSLTCRQWSFPDVSTWSSLRVCSDLFLQGHQSYWVRPVLTTLGWEDPLEKEMATHSSILAWKISWTGEPGGLQSMASQRVGHD